MTSKFHTRSGYEQLYNNICKQVGKQLLDLTHLSDYMLLRSLDFTLREAGCIGLMAEELEMELH